MQVSQSRRSLAFETQASESETRLFLPKKIKQIRPEIDSIDALEREDETAYPNGAFCPPSLVHLTESIIPYREHASCGRIALGTGLETRLE